AAGDLAVAGRDVSGEVVGDDRNAADVETGAGCDETIPAAVVIEGERAADGRATDDGIPGGGSVDRSDGAVAVEGDRSRARAAEDERIERAGDDGVEIVVLR